VGFFFTLRLRFLQARKLGLAFKFALNRKGLGETKAEKQGDISPFQALTTSLAATIGNGNIAGVCTAIAMGGPGAVFWMWLSAFFGMATKIVEAVLGQKFKTILPDGSVAGGPMYYIRQGLNLPFLAGIFAFFMGCKPLFSTSTIQSNSISLALKILYVGGALVTIAIFARQLPQALSLIFIGAFHPAALTGGMAGATVARAIRYGLSRGAYSNEAGTGTAAVFHATAKTSEPVRQGLIASLDVFIDTLIICSLTGLTVLVSGAWTEGTSTQMTVNAFNAALGGGGLIVVASSFLFGYSSLIAVPYYGEIAFSYLFGVGIKKPYRWAFCVLIFLGSILEVEVTWSIGDIFNGMMALSNLIGLVGLSGLAIYLVRNYFRQWEINPTSWIKDK